MTQTKSLKYVFIALGLYIVGVLYLRLGLNHPLGKAMLLSLLCAPVILLWWWVVGHMRARAFRAGERYRQKHE
ncbi:hypothetical protein ACFYRY_10450 [Streptomyces sp. NPDC005263]|uniref:hypothetical protein n=1 Tax=Streptomyces sp. NPDC005263 TaxID=3364711 RepID=UPI0036B13F2F